MASPRPSVLPAIVTAALLAATGSTAYADGKASSDDRVFRFNVSPSGYPPYLINEDGKNSGIMWEVVKEITSRLHYRLEPVEVPRKRVDQLLLDGHIDGTSRAIEWTSDPEAFVFTDPVVSIEEVVFFPADSPHDFNRVEDLQSLTLVTHLGYHYPDLKPYFDAGTITRFDVARDKDLFVFVRESDDMDAAVADRLVGKWVLLSQGMQDEFRASDATLSEYEFRIMLRTEWQSFAEDFNRELASMQENGEIDAILANYR
jgi:polar amino acid transport system substrate-binding protein